MKTPIVYLIGAGPGDPWLISVRGLRCLNQADVVIYDHLVHARLLRQVRADVEKIDVGPAAPEALEQEAICYLLAEKAREGKVVARLKWGDPFVFDRGGEEALFLHEHGVRFEVVPGIPAAIGVPAYAGIPLTYPGAGDTVTFVRGFEDQQSRKPHVDWASLAELGGTVVCYSGPRQLPAIVEAMLAGGWSEGESAALIFGGTTPLQETIQATLGELRQQARQQPRFKDPAILVVGRVAGLREHLRWFDARPLFGKRIVVTRPREQAGELVEALEQLGANVIEAPTVRIVPPDDYDALDGACAGVGSYDWVVFTSANGVDYFFQRLHLGPLDARALAGVRLCAIGPGTADRLARHGLKVDLMPVEYRAEAVVEALRATGDLSGKRFLLPRADIARELLAEELRKSGAEVTEVTAYRSVPVDTDENEPDIYRMLLDKTVDVMTFTSASTVRNFVRRYGQDAVADLLSAVAIASIGPVTAEAAQQCGIRTSIMPEEYTITGLVRAIVEHFEAAAAS
jgi:uroporphyrinogen III methyltransferase / synthase